ncbi:MAG: hypothetical protein GWP08_18260 [Nitrospiraceae bacterium]|nr:hypothetical protein [Nitrospiraceae bacterium]
MRTWIFASLIVFLFICAAAPAGAADDSWKLPLDVKEKLLEQNIVERHNILGLYPSQVEVPLDGRPVDNTTLGIGNIFHSVCWTANYLSGASYRYAFLKKSGAPEAEVAKAKARADEIFEAVYRCQLVTGVRGFQARGYALGYGESYAERWGGGSRDVWHQGVGEYDNLRWPGDPSHHNYSAAVRGMGNYYDLAAEGKQKDRCREAIDALVSWWVDNDLTIGKLDRTQQGVPILGFTDGKTPNTRIMMAISGAKIAYHATGDAKFKATYDQLIDQYGIRGLKEFRAEKDHDDAEHVFCHLENLFRIEDDPELLDAYRVVADALWANHVNDAQSLFTYIYFHLRPDAPDREKAMKEALFSLQTWPTDMTLRPRMNSLRPDLSPPYPVYAAAWDNEYIWKGNLLRADGWLSRTVTDVAVPGETPMVIYAIDTNGDLYQSRDGAATAAGWRPIDQGLRSPVRAIDAGSKIRLLYAACDDGFYVSTTAGYTWQRMPVPDGAGTPVDVQVDPNNDFLVYAVTNKGVYRSLDYGEKYVGMRWETLTEDVPPAGSLSFTLALGNGGHGRIYAIADGDTFTRRLDEDTWQQGAPVGLGGYAMTYPWVCVDPNDSDHAMVGLKVNYPGVGGRNLFQVTTDGGMTWSNDMRALYEMYATGGLMTLFGSLIRGDISEPLFDPRDSSIIYTGSAQKGVLKTTDGGATWQEKAAGLDIPAVHSVFVPRNTTWLFAGTPAGLFLSKDAGETWEDAHLCLQFQKNTRREIGGAAFVDAFWRGRYFGLIDDATAAAPWAGDAPAAQSEPAAPQPAAKDLTAATLAGTRWQTDLGQFGFEEGGKLMLDGMEVGTWGVEGRVVEVSAMGQAIQLEIRGDRIVYEGQPLTKAE